MKKLMFILLMFWALGLRGQEARLVLPVGHNGSVDDLFFSPDNSLLVTESNNITRIWSVKDGILLHTFEGKKAKISPDNRQILVIAIKTVIVYDIRLNKYLYSLEGHQENINYAEFSPKGDLIVTASADKTVRIWDSFSGNELNKFTEHTNIVNSVRFSYDGQSLVSASEDRTAILYDVKARKMLYKLLGHENGLSSAKFSKDNNYVTNVNLIQTEKEFFLGTDEMFFSMDLSNDKTTRIWDARNGNLIRALTDTTQIIVESDFLGEDILITSKDNTRIDFWNYKIGNQIYNYTFNDNLFVSKKLYSLCADLTKLVAPEKDGGISIIEIPNGKKKYIPGPIFNNAVFSNCGNYVAASSDGNGSVLIYSLNKNEIIKMLDGTSISITYCSTIPEKNLINIIAEDNVFRLIDFKNDKIIKELQGIKNVKIENDEVVLLDTSNQIVLNKIDNLDNKSIGFKLNQDSLIAVNDVLYNKNKGILLVSTNENKKIVFDVNKNTTKNVIYNSSSASFSNNGESLVYSTDNSVRILDLTKESEIYNFEFRKNTYKIVPSNDNNRFITLSLDTTIRIIDVNSKIVKEFKGHLNLIKDVYYNSDCSKLFSVSYDSTLKIWDTKKEIASKTIKITSRFEKIILNTDVKTLITSDDVGTIRTYDFEGNLLWEKILDAKLDFLNYIYNGKCFITISNHKTILWDAATGRQLYTRLQLKNNDWLVYDEHYRYDGSQGARDYLYFVCGLEVVDLAQVKDALYVPNLVQRIMNGENLDHLPKLKDLEICGVTPEIEPIENKKDGGHFYNIKSRKGGVGKVEIYINGMLRQTVESKTLTQNYGVYELKIDEKLIQQYQIADKETELKVIARTADNKISSRGAVARTTAKETVYRKPSLHAIMVGIDDYKGEGLDLNYAAKDAIDLQTALKISTQKLFNVGDTNRVHFYNLTLDRSGNIKGLTPDRNNILKTLEKIEKESKPEDVFVLFFAGHGEINPEKQLILLTAEASKEQAPYYSGILMKEMLEKLAKIPAGKRILLLDACHSGAAINELNIKDIAGVRDGEDAEKQSQRLKELENLASKSGLSIITASSTEQKAMELPQYEHGLMTYALLSTMMNDPEVLDKDNNLQLEDWLRQTEKNVSKLIENQSAQRFVPVNFSLGKVDEDVRKSIVLQEIPTIVVANVLNIESGDDDQDIKSQLIKKINEMSTRGGTDKILIAKEDGPNAISVNLSYELIEGKIKSKITLKKEKKVFKQFNFEGNATDLNKFVEELSKEITKNLK